MVSFSPHLNSMSFAVAFTILRGLIEISAGVDSSKQKYFFMFRLGKIKNCKTQTSLRSSITFLSEDVISDRYHFKLQKMLHSLP